MSISHVHIALDTLDRYSNLKHYLDAHDGKAIFPALFTMVGELVAATLVSSRYGISWALLATDDPCGKINDYFRESRACNVDLACRHNAARGYYVGCVSTYGKIVSVGPTPSASRLAIVRIDDGFSRRVEILDSGFQERSSRHTNNN